MDTAPAMSYGWKTTDCLFHAAASANSEKSRQYGLWQGWIKLIWRIRPYMDRLSHKTRRTIWSRLLHLPVPLFFAILLWQPLFLVPFFQYYCDCESMFYMTCCFMIVCFSLPLPLVSRLLCCELLQQGFHLYLFTIRRPIGINHLSLFRAADHDRLKMILKSERLFLHMPQEKNVIHI